MKSLHIFILIIFAALPAFSQSWESVKNNPEYIHGEGWGMSIAEADRQALNDLISKISVHVSSSVTQNEKEVSTNGEIESKSQFQSAVSTYSQATLNNTEKVILENEPDAHVGRWIKRSEINRIFESRKAKVKDYVSSAVKAESQGKIDVALKDFYWALCLVKSLQNPNEVYYETEDDGNVLLLSWIPHKMNEIFSNLDASVARRNGDDVELMIAYKGIPVNSIDYAYFDGRDWSNIYSAKNGIGLLELAPGNQNSNYQLRFEYEYRGEALVDKEVQSVLNALAGTPMRNAYMSIPSKVKDSDFVVADPKDSKSFSTVSKNIFKKPEEVKVDARYHDAVNNVVASIESKQYNAVSDYFTPYGLDLYKKLIKYGNAKVVGKPSVVFYKSNGSITARGIQMSFSFSSGVRKSFVEDMVFTFNEDGKIDNISFGLGKTAEDDILGKGVWDENARFAIMNFLENYQTAYALKRLDYIETIFDDDAVIITGTVVKNPGKRLDGDLNGIQFGNDIIKYNRHTKDSYLKMLKNSFASKEFINLRFADNDVRKLGKGGELYAIQISQEYYSSNYGDKGYLFLMVDINDPEKPIIKVRTWQPEKDPDFGIYGPEHFK